MSMWRKATDWLKAAMGRQPEVDAVAADNDMTMPCCSYTVHIAFRGVSDDRLYLAKNRQWQEVRYYKPNGLRVFCAVCRHRVL